MKDRVHFHPRLIFTVGTQVVLLRNHGQVKWKHVMHLIRLLISGVIVLREGVVAVQVPSEHKDALLAIRRGEMKWEDADRWRRSLHAELDQAFRQSALPERPDYERVNAFLIRARRAAVHENLP